jgi:hypothetical protein
VQRSQHLTAHRARSAAVARHTVLDSFGNAPARCAGDPRTFLLAGMLLAGQPVTPGALQCAACLDLRPAAAGACSIALAITAHRGLLRSLKISFCLLLGAPVFAVCFRGTGSFKRGTALRFPRVAVPLGWHRVNECRVTESALPRRLTAVFLLRPVQRLLCVYPACRTRPCSSRRMPMLL